MSERQKIFVIILALGVFICSAWLLATASPLLLIELAPAPGLPLGTLVAWAGIVSLPVASFLGFQRYLDRDSRLSRASRYSMLCLLLLAAAWGFVSYGLAGNWAFNFSNQSGSFRGSVAAGGVFRAYTVAVVAASLFVSTGLLIVAAVSKLKD
jgi:hypothetical protein